MSRYATVTETQQGYEVRRRGRATVESFPFTDPGFDAAWDRYVELTRAGRSGRLLSTLAIVGVVAAALWFVVTLVSAIGYVVVTQGSPDDTGVRLLSWVSPFAAPLYALFAGAVGSYAVVWLSRRGMPAASRRR